MVYKNNAGRLGSGFISVCLELAGWVQKAVSMCRNDPVGLKKNTSSGVKTKMHLTPIRIRLITSLPTTSLLYERDSILVQLGTLGALRQSELISLNVCDWLMDRECDFKGQSYSAMVFLKRQKNDHEWKVRWKRIEWVSYLLLFLRICRRNIFTLTQTA